MLDKLRRDFKKYSWTLWLVIIMFMGGFVLTDLFRGRTARKNDVVVIDDVRIDRQDFQKQLTYTLRQYDRQMNNQLSQSFIQQLNIPGQALNRLINSAVIQMEADRYNIMVTDQEVADAVRGAFSQNGEFVGKSRYQQILQMNQLTATEFEADLRKDLRSDKLKELVTSGLTIPGSRLFRQYRADNESAGIDYISLSTALIKQDPPVSDEEVQAQYEENREEYVSPEKRKGVVVVLSTETFQEQVTVTDREIADYYLAHREEFRETGKTRVSRIFLPFTQENREEVGREADEIKAELEGLEETAARLEKFKEIAMQRSGDEKAEEGGDYGYQEWQAFTEPEVTTIKRLKTGEISNVVGASDGFSIFCVTEKIPTRTQPLNEVRDIIRDNLMEEKARSRMEESAMALVENARSSRDLKKAGLEAGYEPVETGFLANGEGIEDVDMTGQVTGRLFALEKDAISEPVGFYLGTAVVQLTEIQEPRPLELEDVRERVVTAVQNLKKLQQLEKRTEEVYGRISALQNEEERVAYLQKQDLAIESVEYGHGNRLQNYPVFQGLDQLVFNPDTTLDTFLDPLKMGDAMVLIRIRERQLVDRSEFERNRESFYTKKLAELKNNYFTSFIFMKRDQYEIRFNQKVYDEVVERETGRYK